MISKNANPLTWKFIVVPGVAMIMLSCGAPEPKSMNRAQSAKFVLKKNGRG